MKPLSSRLIDIVVGIVAFWLLLFVISVPLSIVIKDLPQMLLTIIPIFGGILEAVYNVVFQLFFPFALIFVWIIIAAVAWVFSFEAIDVAFAAIFIQVRTQKWVSDFISKIWFVIKGVVFKRRKF